MTLTPVRFGAMYSVYGPQKMLQSLCNDHPAPLEPTARELGKGEKLSTEPNLASSFGRLLNQFITKLRSTKPALPPMPVQPSPAFAQLAKELGTSAFTVLPLFDKTVVLTDDEHQKYQAFMSNANLDDTPDAHFETFLSQNPELSYEDITPITLTSNR